MCIPDRIHIVQGHLSREVGANSRIRCPFHEAGAFKSRLLSVNKRRVAPLARLQTTVVIGPTGGPKASIGNCDFQILLQVLLKPHCSDRTGHVHLIVPMTTEAYTYCVEVWPLQ